MNDTLFDDARDIWVWWWNRVRWWAKPFAFVGVAFICFVLLVASGFSKLLDLATKPL